tara:strand:+ start:4405 stop:5079 length:675 start_codon:yes stop_codon:yes gene_type:complete
MKIIILIRSYERPNYLAKTIKTLLNSDISKVKKIYVYDDNSKNKETHYILNNLDKNLFTVIKGKKNYGVNKSFVYFLKNIRSRYKNKKNILIITIDNDVIMKKKWIDILSKAFIKAKKYYKSNKLILTGFNSTNAHVNTYKNRIYSKNKLFYRKQSIGGVNMVFDIAFLNFVIKIWNKGADWGIVHKMIKLNYPILCLNKSVINHIGRYGRWSSPGDYNYDKYF